MIQIMINGMHGGVAALGGNSALSPEVTLIQWWQIISRLVLTNGTLQRVK
jgi:hypothetical protein